MAGVLAALAAVYLLLAFSRAVTKVPWCDEGTSACPAYHLAFHGKLATTVLEPSGHFLNAYLQGVQQRTYLIMPLQPVTLAAWSRLFGFSLLATRALGILWGGIALVALFVLVRRLTQDSVVAVGAVAFTILDFIFLTYAADGRPDMMCIALGLGAQAVYLLLRERNVTLAVAASHTLTAVAFLVHPNAFLAALGLVLLALYFDRGKIRIRHLALAAIPYLVGAALWGAYILQAPGDFRSQFFANAAGRSSERWEQLYQPWLAVWRELVWRYLATYSSDPGPSLPKPAVALYIPIVLLSVLAACFWNRAIRAHRGRNALVLLTLTSVLGMTFLVGHKGEYYLPYVLPLLNALLALWLCLKWKGDAFTRAAAGMLVAGVLLLQVGLTVHRVRQNPLANDYLPVIRLLRDFSAQGKTILCTSALGFDLDYRTFRDDARRGMYSGLRPDVIVVDWFYDEMVRAFALQERSVFVYVVNQETTQYHTVLTNSSFTVLRRNTPSPLR